MKERITAVTYTNNVFLSYMNVYQYNNIGSLSWVLFRARRVVGWIDGLREAGLDPESLDALEAMDAALASKSQRQIIAEFQEASARRVTEFRHEVEAESAEWSRSRRMEYLNDRRQELIKQIVNTRIAAGNLIIDHPKDGAFITAFMSVADLEREVKKIDNEIKFRWAPKPMDRISEHDIERAKAFPLWRLLEKQVGQKVVCIWHSDSRPSFHLYADGKGHCFVCGKGGDAIDWVMESRGLNFIEAVRSLL